MLNDRMHARIIGEAIRCHAFHVGCRKYRQALLRGPDSDFMEMSSLNDRLEAGFEVVAWEAGEGDYGYFFESLSRARFPIARQVRPIDQLANAEMPDALHDLIGHVPYLFLADTATMIKRMGDAWCKKDCPVARDGIQRLWFHVIEFGLVVEDGAMRAFGAGLVTSIAAFRAVRELPVEFARFDAMMNAPLSDEGLPDRYFLHERRELLMQFIDDGIAMLEST